jgi:hypothetical protein
VPRSLDSVVVRMIDGLRRLVFVALCTAIVAVGSERMFWYWASSPADHGIVTLVYAPCVAGALWLVAHFRVHDVWGLLLVAPAFGLLVEGVITPVVYSGGPFVPFFPVWFGVWHGVLGMMVLLFGVRWWLVTGDRRRLLTASTLLGIFWGTWSITLLLPENVGDPEMVADHGGALHVLDPTEFMLYAVTFSFVLAVAHFLLGRGWWLTTFEPSRPVTVLWIVATGAVVVAWTFVIPWAAPMFAAYLGLQIWGLRRDERVAARPSLLERLDGRFPARALLPLAAMPVAASGTYAAWWAIDLPEGVVRGAFMYGTIAAQTVVGAVAFVLALRRAGRSRPLPAPEAWPAPVSVGPT